MVKHLKVEQSDEPKPRDERVDDTRPDRPNSEELEEEPLPGGFESEFREKMESVLRRTRPPLPPLRAEVENPRWEDGAETTRFREAKEEIGKWRITPLKLYVLEAMETRYDPGRDMESLKSRDGISLEEIRKEVWEVRTHKSSFDYGKIIEEILIPLQRSGFAMKFELRYEEYPRNAITSEGRKVICSPVPKGGKLDTGTVHQLRTFGASRVFTLHGYFYYPVWHWKGLGEYSEGTGGSISIYDEPDFFAIPPTRSRSGLDPTSSNLADLWLWDQALFGEVVFRPKERRSGIRANVRKNLGLGRRTVFVATSLDHAKVIARESRKVLREKTRSGCVGIGTRAFNPNEAVLIQPIPRLLPSEERERKLKSARTNREVAKARVDGRNVSIETVSGSDYMRVTKPDGSRTTVGKATDEVKDVNEWLEKKPDEAKRYLESEGLDWTNLRDVLLLQKRKRTSDWNVNIQEDKVEVGKFTFEKNKELMKRLKRLITEDKFPFDLQVWEKYNEMYPLYKQM